MTFDLFLAGDRFSRRRGRDTWSEDPQVLPMPIRSLNLLVPEKADVERGSVAEAWQQAGGRVTALGRFWDPPELDIQSVRIYGNDSFALVLAQKLGLDLVCPADDLLVKLPNEWLRRTVRILTLAQANELPFPAFVKPVTPKLFRASVYRSYDDLEIECRGLDRQTAIYVSEVVVFAAEARGFVLNGEVRTAALYEGSESLEGALELLRKVARSDQLPVTCVLDVGFISGSGWAMVEANASWGAGLNGCAPDRVIECIAHATRI